MIIFVANRDDVVEVEVELMDGEEDTSYEIAIPRMKAFS